MKRNILIISIYYPPIQSIASNRLYSFAKYLDKEKYNIYVHTLEEGKGFHHGIEGVEVTRSKNDMMLKPFKFNKRTNKILHYSKVIYNVLIKRLQKDMYQAWINDSISMLSSVIEKNNVDIMLSSFAPASTHKVALSLKMRHPHIKWIADMRDEMSANPFIDKKTKISYEALEQKIFHYADAITSVSKPILDEYKVMSQGSHLSFQEIRNGYDFEIENVKEKNEIFTIAYVGNFYGTRNPNNFLKALSTLVKNGALNDIKIKFIGVKTHFEIPENIKAYLSMVGNIVHGDAIEEMRNSDALLLIHPNNGRKGIFTGKIFEYLATKKPIIALVDFRDVAADLIRECDAGYVSDFDDIEGIKKAIIQTYYDWENNTVNEVNIDLIKKHHRKEQTKRLEKLIEELTSE